MIEPVKHVKGTFLVIFGLTFVGVAIGSLFSLAWFFAILGLGMVTGALVRLIVLNPQSLPRFSDGVYLLIGAVLLASGIKPLIAHL